MLRECILDSTLGEIAKKNLQHFKTIYEWSHQLVDKNIAISIKM